MGLIRLHILLEGLMGTFWNLNFILIVIAIFDLVNDVEAILSLP